MIKLERLEDAFDIEIKPVSGRLWGLYAHMFDKRHDRVSYIVGKHLHRSAPCGLSVRAIMCATTLVEVLCDEEL